MGADSVENAGLKIDRKTVRVLLPLPLAGPYDYRVPQGMRVAPGDFVLAPLGRKRLAGVVWGPAAGGFAEEKLKPLADKISRLK